jgi:hypothetical protein
LAIPPASSASIASKTRRIGGVIISSQRSSKRIRLTSTRRPIVGDAQRYR